MDIEKLKKLFKGDDRVEYIAKINSYDFNYKPEAQEELGVDGDEHTGVIAQELDDNPVFKGVVTTDEDTGLEMLKVPELAASAVAAEGDLARKVLELELRLSKLEKMLGDR